VTLAIRNPKDFWMGVLYFGISGFGLVVGRDYAIGSTVNMGPGYFPFYISCLLVIFGVISWFRAFATDGEPIGAIAWKALALITGSVVMFGFLLEQAGLLISMPLLLVATALASERFGFEWKAAAGVVAFTAICAATFTYALGLPIPLLGAWFG
jgi:hypothetical protein